MHWLGSTRPFIAPLSAAHRLTRRFQRHTHPGGQHGLSKKVNGLGDRRSGSAERFRSETGPQPRNDSVVPLRGSSMTQGGCHLLAGYPRQLNPIDQQLVVPIPCAASQAIVVNPPVAQAVAPSDPADLTASWSLAASATTVTSSITATGFSR